MGKYVDIFKKIFEQKNFDDAIDYVQYLKSEINIFPKF